MVLKHYIAGSTAMLESFITKTIDIDLENPKVVIYLPVMTVTSI